MTLIEYINQAESLVREYKEMVDSGHLTPSEFHELVEDFTDLTRIEGDLELEENKILVQKTFNVIQSIISAV
jgi:polyhydroxyalkanoate synthesis regulator phasin